MGFFFSKIFGNSQKEYKIIMIGLNNAGKTSILYRLNLGEVI